MITNFRENKQNTQVHRWAKGHSGNPGGRPKSNPEIVEILKAASVQAAKLLVSLVNNEQVSQRIRLQAAEIILDRVYGKPSQPIDATIGGNGLPVSIKFEGKLKEWSL